MVLRIILAFTISTFICKGSFAQKIMLKHPLEIHFSKVWYKTYSGEEKSGEIGFTLGLDSIDVVNSNTRKGEIILGYNYDGSFPEFLHISSSKSEIQKDDSGENVIHHTFKTFQNLTYGNSPNKVLKKSEWVLIEKNNKIEMVIWDNQFDKVYAIFTN